MTYTPTPKVLEIKEKLINRGYHIGKYGLIIDNENKEVIAEIRFSQEMVVLPKDSEKKENRKMSRLRKILLEEYIPHRDAYLYSF